MRLLSKNIFLLLSILALSSCISLKTDEEIKKERVVEGLPGQVEQSQKLMAQVTLRMNELENRLQNYTGEIEEIEYRQQKLIPDSQKAIQEQIANQSKEIRALRSEITANQETIANLDAQIGEQKKYISKVNATLTSLSKAPVKTASKPSPVIKLNDFQTGISYYKRRRYKDAEDKILFALKNQKLNAAEVNQSYQALGHIEFSRKNYSKSNIYFSKIFTKYPKSSMAPDALIHMARAFKNQKNEDAAKEAYQTFLKEYPSHTLASSVKEELNAL